MALRNQGIILNELGDFEGAAHAYDSAIDIQEGLKSWLELGRSYYQRSMLRTKLGQDEGANDDIQAAIKLFEQCGAVYDLRLASNVLNPS